MTPIVFTGGGSGGHVMKNLIVMRELKKQHPDIRLFYVGSRNGLEAKLVPEALAVMKVIPSGKLRRYFSLWTGVDLVKLFFGFWVGLYFLLRIQPVFVFSSGGYVALPICVAAWVLRIPVVTHETDSVPGWTTRILAKLADRVCLGFESALEHFKVSSLKKSSSLLLPLKGGAGSERSGEAERVRGDVVPEWRVSAHPIEKKPDKKWNPPHHTGSMSDAKECDRGVLGRPTNGPVDKFVVTGNPIRPELYHGDRRKAASDLGFSEDKRTVLVTGGSQGAQRINDFILDILDRLTGEAQVIHVTGKGKAVDVTMDGYVQFEYVDREYADLLALADVVVSRAGGNSLAELEALQKPTVVIPLSTSASDHQMKNAMEVAGKNDLFTVLDETSGTSAQLLTSIEVKLKMVGDRPAVKDTATEKILQVLEPYLRG